MVDVKISRTELLKRADVLALFANSGNVTERNRGRLPHREGEGCIYFVTFRLFDSLPLRALKAIHAERSNIIVVAKQQRRELSAVEQQKMDRLFTEKIETYLDAGLGSCFLRRPEIAGLVAEALRHFRGQRYDLYAWCLMPNPVHVVFRPLPQNRLAAILHSWKSFTATHANRLLRRSGEFWQHEYYDHIVRDPEDLVRVIEYTEQNPSRANLPAWRWVEVLL